MASGDTLRATKASSVPFFYGRITRDEAEVILNDRGCIEGLFLLRESISPLGNYAISVCHDSKIHHYVIEKQADGTFMIPAGKKFIGPVELIHHHMESRDGIVTQLTIPCDRSDNQLPIAFRGMTYHDLEQELLRKAESIRGVRLDRAMGAQREHLVIMVAKDLHTKQPWYHGKINRTESEKRLQLSGHKDGKFLVRMRDDKKTFAICISYQKDTRHYLIDKNQENKYGIQDGPKFECIMMLIDHYHNKQDGLLCKLSEPCPSPGFDPVQLQKYQESNVGNLEYFRVGGVNGLSLTRQASRTSLGKLPPTPGGSTPPPIPSTDRRPSLGQRAGGSVKNKRALPPLPDEARWLSSGDWEGGQSSVVGGFDSRRNFLKRFGDAEQLESIYGSVPRTEAHFDLQRHQIDIQETLGSGQFGSVCKGLCTLKNGQKVPVAIKTLKKENMDSTKEPELITEAKLMMPLSHKHIVRMIGLCKSESIMLVLELAPLGQLNTYLSQHRDTILQDNIVELMWQVALGMEYLESKKFVHRDLAARNVLLVSEHFAKISDFGMSRALARDNNYYEAKEAGKWPLKWYAPECVYYWKFDSKSDVWSYGVTLWEATSYGERPYQKMKGQEILKFLVDDNQRLAKPALCDEEVYRVMLMCWEYEKEQRPNFKEIANLMQRNYLRLKSESRR